jgi:hypothetical protein
VTDEEETLRLRRELADAKVEQIQARLAEIQAGHPEMAAPGHDAVRDLQAGLAQIQGTHPEIAAQVQDALRQAQTRLAEFQASYPQAMAANPAAQESLRQVLGQVGMAGYVPGPAPSTPPPPDFPLSAPPRPVPLSYRLFLLPWSTWTVFALFMIAVSPIAVWIFWPIVGVAVAIVVFLGIMVLAMRKYVRLMGLLRWGQQATSVEAVPLDVGTYYSGTTYQNMRLPIARGWQVTRKFYSGPGTKTRVRYQLGEATGELTLRGREYIDGVILVNSRKPEIAACVTAIPFDLAERTPSGDWSGRVRKGTIIGAVAMFVFVIGWTAAMIVFCGMGAASLDQLPFG